MASIVWRIDYLATSLKLAKFSVTERTAVLLSGPS